MISDERMETFLASLDAGNTPFLDQIEREALETNVPVIRTQTQGLLRFLLALHKPMSILEVGCAIGFSALLMSEYAPAGCKITTIEKYEKRIPVAKANFVRAEKEDAITLLEGDAADILKELTGPYDFIFMDAARGSIFISCRRFCGFLRRAASWCPTMCYRTAIFWNPGLPWSGETARFTAGCGNISMSLRTARRWRRWCCPWGTA